MHPRPQKGACSGVSGLPHSGHFFGLSDAFGIPARHGKIGLSAQADGAADLRGKLVEPAGMFLQHAKHAWVRNEPFRSSRFGRSPSQ